MLGIYLLLVVRDDQPGLQASLTSRVIVDGLDGRSDQAEVAGDLDNVCQRRARPGVAEQALENPNHDLNPQVRQNDYIEDYTWVMMLDYVSP